MGIWEALFGKKKIQEVSNEADAGFNSEFEVNQKNLKKIEAEEAAAETAAAKAAEENAPAAEETAEPADAAAAPAAEEAAAAIGEAEAAVEEAEAVVEEADAAVVEADAAVEEAEAADEEADAADEEPEAAVEVAVVETPAEEAEAPASDDVVPAEAEEAAAEAETAAAEEAVVEAEEAAAEAETAEAEAVDEAEAEAETAEAETAEEAEEVEAESETAEAEEAAEEEDLTDEAAVTEEEPAAEEEAEPAAEVSVDTAPAAAEEDAAGEEEEPEAEAESAADEEAEAAEDKEEPAAETEAEAPAAAPEAVKEAPAAAPDIMSIEPKEVFRYFKIICDIPHGSFNTEGISNFLVKFAAGHNYKCVKDDRGNVIIFAPATPGCEEAPALILQGHMDMVCETAPGCDADMTRDPVRTLVEGDWLTADGTTLGGDDGIAVAMMLAVLDSSEIPHPALECIFTTDEEVGLQGAEALDASEITGRRMLNMDSESEGAFTVGCAGGADMILAVHGRRSEKSGRVLRIRVGGLLGGHSGEMIGAGRANADLLMARILYTLYRKTEFRLLSVQGGNKDNAIPREAEASLLFPAAVDRKKVKKQIKEIRKALKNEYAVCDPGLKVKADWIKENVTELRPAFTKNDTRKFIRFLMTVPNGVIEYTPGLAGMPQTSLNLGILTTAADGISAEFLIRSSVNSQKQMMMDRLACIAAQFEGNVRIVGQYPAWEYRTESDFRDLLQGVYKDTYGKEAGICVTHGGLECGLLAAKMPGLDAVSIGPEMSGIHTPDEKLNIPSVQRTWQFLKAALEACGRE